MRKYIDLAKQTFQEFGQDKAPRLGAALAYYTVFSIAPLLLIAIAMAGMVFGDEAARGALSTQLSNVMGPAMADSLQTMIAAANKPDSGTIATIIGIVTLLFGASGVFGQLKDALNTIWNVEEKKGAGVMGFIKDRFLSMAMVCGIGFLLLVTLVFDTVIAAMGGMIGNRMPGGEALLHALQLVVSFALITVLFAVIFKYLPDIKIGWKDVWVGAAFTSLLFVLGKFALGFYIAKTAANSSFGAAGSLVVLLVWVYWSAQILFLGAEFTQVWARTHGSLKGDNSKREARAGAAKPEDRPKAQVGADGKPQGVPGRGGAPAYARSAAPAKKGGSAAGTAGKLAAGGVAGLFIGGLVGLVSGIVIVVKSVKKLIPFR
ncbi:MAG TPA: YihY/virulence factor BrkB family protein [Thermoanaerobaculia bacterium]|jgi:membrane protein